MADLQDILAAASLREESVDVCMAGELNARWEALGRELADLTAMTAGEPTPTAKLSDASPMARRGEISEQMESLRQQMLAASFTFKFRAMPRREYRTLRDEHPPRADKRNEGLFNMATFPPALIRACMVDPVIATDGDWEKLQDLLTEGQITELFNAAWLCNEGGSEVPKFVPGSGRIPSTE